MSYDLLQCLGWRLQTLPLLKKHWKPTYNTGGYTEWKYISIIGTIFSIWSVGISLAGKSSAVKFRRYRKKGIDMKESKQLGKAMLWYKKSLNHAETAEQESDIWWLTTHIHTDRLIIGASQQWTGCTE